jgi:sec-independent protein translocase protein TatB
VFGLSFGELLIIGVIAIVVVGPRNLPSLLRNAGHMIGKLRRMATDLRAESGIDEILEHEGIRTEIDNFRRLAAGQISLEDLSPNVVPEREREYPRIGCDSYGAVSEDLVPYLPPPPELGPAPPHAVPALPADASSALAEGGTSAPSAAAPAAGVPKATLPPSNGAGAKN